MTKLKIGDKVWRTNHFIKDGEDIYHRKGVIIKIGPFGTEVRWDKPLKYGTKNWTVDMECWEKYHTTWKERYTK